MNAVEEKVVKPVDNKEKLSKVLKDRVLKTLERPYHSIKVIPLWGNYFRVNVWKEQENAAVVVSKSHFVHMNPSGDVLYSDPSL